MAIAAFQPRDNPPQWAENVSRNESRLDLPADARDVSYCHGYRGTMAYEFTIDEPGFVAWVESGIGSLEAQAANIQLRPIVAPVTTPFRTRTGESPPDAGRTRRRTPKRGVTDVIAISSLPGHPLTRAS